MTEPRAHVLLEAPVAFRRDSLADFGSAFGLDYASQTGILTSVEAASAVTISKGHDSQLRRPLILGV